MGRFDGKVAWVTGAASGIGRATALRFAREGANVAISDINKDGCEAVAEQARASGVEALALPCDVTSLSDCEEAVARIDEAWGRLDAVFANAGILSVGFVEHQPEADFQRVLDVNLTGVFRTAKSSMALLRKSGGGAIVFTSSVEGVIGNLVLPAYCATKSGVIGLARALCHEGAPSNIRVNCIGPGLVETGMTEGLLNNAPAFREDWVNKTPLGRPGHVDDVAGVVLFFCSDDAGYVTGQYLAIDGGVTAVR